MEVSLLALLYLLVAMVLAPWLTNAAAITFDFLTYLFRNVLKSGYSIGDRVADANVRIQEYEQARAKGIRGVKPFCVSGEKFYDFRTSVNAFAHARIKYLLNRKAIGNYYNFATAIMVFVLIYDGLNLWGVTLREIGVFLFAMSRFCPAMSQLNHRICSLEGGLAHLVWSRRIIDELRHRHERRDTT